MGPLKSFLKESDMIQFAFYNDARNGHVQMIR